MGDVKEDKCLQNWWYRTEYDLLANHALAACCQDLVGSLSKPPENKAPLPILEVMYNTGSYAASAWLTGTLRCYQKPLCYKVTSDSGRRGKLN